MKPNTVGDPAMEPAKTCPNCGAPMPAGVLVGLCPGCLLDQGASTVTGGPPHGARFAPPSVEEVARLFPQLEVLGLLGAGGMGAVYKARQPALDRLVAVKILPPHDAHGLSFAERFNREARALARLSHPHIVAVHEFGQAGGMYYFIMEYVDGANLRQLEKTSRLAPREALQIIPQICDALQYAHDEGVVHRDIKPENVLIDRKGRVKIADFGLAKILDPDPEAARLTAEGQVMGTPHYMAPEQIERPLTVDHRADIYSLGVVFYEMLTGELPLGKFAPPSRKVEVDVRLDEIVLRALENDPARRYQHASEVKARVATVASAPEPAVVPPGEPASLAPAASAAASAGAGTTGPRHLHWAGMPVVVERDGEREVSFQGAATAIFVTMVCAGVAHLLVRWLSGGEHALSGLVVPAGFLTVIWGIRRAMNQPWDTAPEEAGAEMEPRRIIRELLPFVVLFAFVVGSHYLKTTLTQRAKAGQEKDRMTAQHDARPANSPATLMADLPGRGTLELLAIGEANANPPRWWRPNGTLLTNAPAGFAIQSLPAPTGPSARQVDFVFRASGRPPEVGEGFEFEPDTMPTMGGDITENGVPLKGGWALRAVYSPASRTATLRFGVAMGDPRPVLIYSPTMPVKAMPRLPGDAEWPTNLVVSEYADGVRVVATLGPNAYMANDGGMRDRAIVPGPEAREWRMQILMVGKNGVTRSSPDLTQSVPTDNAPTFSVWTNSFAGISLKQIEAVRLEVQRMEWAVFRDLPLHPIEPPHVAERDPVTGALTYALATGGRIELLALGEPEAAPGGWWTPEGTPIRNAAFQVRDISPVRHEDDRQLDLVFRLPATLPDGKLAGFDVPTALRVGGGGEVRQAGERLAGGWPIRVAWPRNERKATVRLAVGTGDWRLLSHHEPLSASTIWKRDRELPDLGLSMHPAVDTTNGMQATFALAKRDANWRYRITAIDQRGAAHPGEPGAESAAGTVRLVTYAFAGLARLETREIRVEVQRLDWMEFRDVALVPASPVPPPQPRQYGPVTEVQFNELLDLDDGRLGRFPTDTKPVSLPEGLAANVAWMQQNGFDAEARTGTIGFLGTRIVYLDPRDWDGLAPDELGYRLRELGAMPDELQPPMPALPLTVGFRTREGGSGLLQITAYAGDRPGASVRIKRVTP